MTMSKLTASGDGSMTSRASMRSRIVRSVGVGGSDGPSTPISRGSNVRMVLSISWRSRFWSAGLATFSALKSGRP